MNTSSAADCTNFRNQYSLPVLVAVAIIVQVVVPLIITVFTVTMLPLATVTIAGIDNNSIT